MEQGLTPMEEIFSLQEKLIQAYYKKGKVPFRLHDLLSTRPSAQQLQWLKSLVADMAEEIGEAFEGYEVLHMKVMDQNGTEKDKDTKNIQDLCINLSIEVADILHFMAEICLYTGFTTSELSNFIDYICEMEGMAFTEGDALKRGMDLAKYQNFRLGRKGEAVNILQIKYPYVNSGSIRAHLKNFRAGNVVSSIRLNDVKDQAFELMRDMIALRRAFRAKLWRETNDPISVDEVHRFIGHVVLGIFRFADLLDMGPDDLHVVYIHKNQINHDRNTNAY